MGKAATPAPQEAKELDAASEREVVMVACADQNPGQAPADGNTEKGAPQQKEESQQKDEGMDAELQQEEKEKEKPQQKDEPRQNEGPAERPEPTVDSAVAPKTGWCC